MTTIVNTPAPSNDSGGSMGMIVGLIVLGVLGLLFFVYGLPAIQRMSSGGVQVNVPEKIDVQINQTQ